MRKYIKKQILDIIGTLYEAHISISNFIEHSEFDNTVSLLGDCQNTAVQIGDIIDNSEGEGSPVIHFLEEYCESVYQVSVGITNNLNSKQAKKMLDDNLSIAENSINNDVPVRTEIVFMPYNASMWDSLESVWKAADEDPNCDAYVVPIPYYERNPDQSLGQYHYEGDRFPEYVPITHYSKYDLEKRRPDTIYIHNPYDGNNFITTVDPRYYSSELKKYTDMLVYIPYFVLEDREIWDDKYLENIEKFALVPGVLNADKVIVQSENMRKIYIRTLMKYCGSSLEHLKIYTEKIIGIGSPKYDKLYEAGKKHDDIKDMWREKADGKKILFFNTNVNLILKNGNHFFENLRRILTVIKQYENKIFVIWREHPLSNSTIRSLGDNMEKCYNKIKKEYIAMNIGVFDYSSEPYDAMNSSDCYYGAGGSLIPIYSTMGKPIMVTDYNYPNGIKNKNDSLDHLIEWKKSHTYMKDMYSNSLALFFENIDVLSELFPNKLYMTNNGCDSISAGRFIHYNVNEIIMQNNRVSLF